VIVVIGYYKTVVISAIILCRLWQLIYKWLSLCICAGSGPKRLPTEPVVPLALPAPPPLLALPAPPTPPPKVRKLSWMRKWPKVVKVWAEDEVYKNLKSKKKLISDWHQFHMCM
jgi:hypothetical protein